MMESLVGHPYVGDFGCFVVVRKALEFEGKHVPDYSDELTEANRLAVLHEKLLLHGEQTSDPGRGDVVLLKIAGQPTHIGIMLNDREMLHCMAGINACIERLDSVRWRGRVLGYWRIS